MQKAPIKLYLAPLQGYTDYRFRTAFFTTGGYADAAFAPFIDTHAWNAKDQKDILPENNKAIPIIPQLIGNDANEMVKAVGMVMDLGYKEINWNLGCPYPMVTRKKMGAGLLPFPERILEILDVMYSQCTIRLSIKMRLGLNNQDDWQALSPILNRFPLCEVIIHARSAAQMYSDSPNLRAFAQAAAMIEHPVCYNGDIFSLENFRTTAAALPGISRFMLGRGILLNPSLPREIITNTKHTRAEICKNIDCLHDQLLYQHSLGCNDPTQIMHKMKLYWGYYSCCFGGQEKEIKKIKKAATMDEYLMACREIFTSGV